MAQAWHSGNPRHSMSSLSVVRQQQPLARQAVSTVPQLHSLAAHPLSWPTTHQQAWHCQGLSEAGSGVTDNKQTGSLFTWMASRY